MGEEDWEMQGNGARGRETGKEKKRESQNIEEGVGVWVQRKLNIRAGETD